MKQKIKKILPKSWIETYRNIKPAFVFKKSSYSQCGEDLILEHALRGVVKDKSINYCDIGANSPWKISNTAKFYKNGGGIGVLVEPDPFLARFLKSKRPKDIVVNKGVKIADIKDSHLEFYIMDSKTLNTFSLGEANKYKSLGYKIEETINVEVVDINALLGEYFTKQEIHLLSIDVEGIDFDILKSLDFSLYRPVSIVIETVEFVTSGIAKKDDRITDFLVNNGYFEYAFTGINSIFIDKEKWLSR